MKNVQKSNNLRQDLQNGNVDGILKFWVKNKKLQEEKKKEGEENNNKENNENKGDKGDKDKDLEEKMKKIIEDEKKAIEKIKKRQRQNIESLIESQINKELMIKTNEEKAKKQKYKEEKQIEETEKKKKILNTQQDEPVGEQLLPEQSSETQENKSDVVVEEDATPIMRQDESSVAFEQPKVKSKPETTNETTTSSKVQYWAALLGVFILLVISLIFIIIAVKCNGSDNNDYDDQTYPDSLEESIEDIVDSTEYVEDDYETITSSDDDEFAYDPWIGRMEIDGFVYRTCDVLCNLDLEKLSTGMYSGTISLILGAMDEELNRFENEYGWLDGTVRGRLDGNTLIVVLDSYTIKSGQYGDFITGQLSVGSQLYRITYNDGIYTAKAIGKMEGFHECDVITVKK